MLTLRDELPKIETLLELLTDALKGAERVEDEQKIPTSLELVTLIASVGLARVEPKSEMRT